MQEDTAESLKGAIRVDAGQLRSHIDEAVRSSVEETLNRLLDAEADQICGAVRYQRSADRVDTRAGHYERQLETNSEALTLVLGDVYRTISRHLIGKAGLRRATGAPGAVTLVQRFGSALNLNVHFHMVFLGLSVLRERRLVFCAA